MFLHPLFSHINQKTQFENPVMEAKKKLSAEAPSGAPPPATTSPGRCAGSHEQNGSISIRAVIWNMPIYQKMFTLPPLAVDVPAVARLVINTSACYTFLCWLGDRQIMLKGACNLLKKKRKQFFNQSFTAAEAS